MGEIKKDSRPLKFSKEEVLKLIARYQETGCKESLTQLVTHFKGLVESLSVRYSKRQGLHEDIVQVGMIGLIGAVKRFDPSYEKNFEAFAIPTIIGEMKRFLRDNTWSVHVPRKVKELYPKINNANIELMNSLQSIPTTEDIANYLQIPEESVIEVLEMAQSYQSLSIDHENKSTSDGATFSILDVEGTFEKGYDRQENLLVLKQISHILSEREKKILHFTFFQNLSQKCTGEKLGISQMHVSRLQRKAIEKLRKELNKEKKTIKKLRMTNIKWAFA